MSEARELKDTDNFFVEEFSYGILPEVLGYKINLLYRDGWSLKQMTEHVRSDRKYHIAIFERRTSR